MFAGNALYNAPYLLYVAKMRLFQKVWCLLLLLLAVWWIVQQTLLRWLKS